MNSPLSSALRDPVFRRWLPLILGLAVGIRAALGWMHPFFLPDSADYLALGQALAHGQPYASGTFAVAPSGAVTPYVASRMPGYPLFLATVDFFGGGVRAVLVLQAFMGGLIVLLTYALGNRISRRTGLLAAALAALDPLSIGFSAAVLTEIPFTLCLLAALWLCLRIIDGQSPTRPAATSLRPAPLTDWQLWIALGLLWAIATYFRASALLAIVPLALAASLLAASPAHRLAAFARCLIPLAIVVALLTPWLIRNYLIFHSGPLRLTTLEGISLYEAVYPQATGGPMQSRINLDIPPDMKSLNEAQRNDEWNRRAWSCIVADPLRIARLALAKIGRTWSPWFHAADFDARPIQWAMTLWYLPLLALALLGLFSAMPRGLRILVVIPLGYFTAIHALFLGSVRYRVPLLPLVCLLAAHGVFRTLHGIFRGQRPPAPAV